MGTQQTAGVRPVVCRHLSLWRQTHVPGAQYKILPHYVQLCRIEIKMNRPESRQHIAVLAAVHAMFGGRCKGDLWWDLQIDAAIPQCWMSFNIDH